MHSDLLLSFLRPCGNLEVSVSESAMATNAARQHTRKYRVDQLESLVDLLADFSTSQDNLATDED